MNKKFLLVLIFCMMLGVSHGLRGFYDHKVLAVSNVTTEEYLKYAKEYAKHYGVSFYKLYGSENTRAKREIENATISVDKKARFLGLLMMPGSSGSYASSNSFYLYGKLVNSAVSLSYAPVQGNIARPIAAVAADVPTQVGQPGQPVPINNGVQRYPTRTAHQYYNTFYPYFLFPYNFNPKKTNDSKG